MRDLNESQFIHKIWLARLRIINKNDNQVTVHIYKYYPKLQY